MTDRTKSVIRNALQWGALFIPALGGAWSIARAVGATKLDTAIYASDRRADSLTHFYEQKAVNAAILRTDSTLTDIRMCLRTKVCP